MRRQNAKFLVVGIIVALAVGYLVYSATKNAGVYYLTVKELKNKKNTTDIPVRVSGKVMEGTVKQHWKKSSASNRDLIYRFAIQEGGESLAVTYQGSLPDTFNSGREVVAEGMYGEDGMFKAEKIMAKCPSKYQAKNINDQG